MYIQVYRHSGGKRIMAMRMVVLAVLLTAWGSAVCGADLYKVAVRSDAEAERLRVSGAEAVFALQGAFLVLAEADAVASMRTAGLSIERIAEAIGRDELALERMTGHEKSPAYPLLYTDGSLNIRHLDTRRLPVSERVEYVPIRVGRTPIRYYPIKALNENLSPAEYHLDSLIGLVSQDSVMAYTRRLQAFYRRLTGTDSCYAAIDWIAAKFASFGYGSVVIDDFTGCQLYDYIFVPSQNVIATKIGTRYPDKQVIIGAHLDAVPDGPGADDNASGTAGVLEIARVLSHIQTDVTFIFVAFDSEESWMWGSYHYVDEALANGDDITYMMNLDMIGYFPNDTFANLYYGPQQSYARLWASLADSLVGISGHLSGSTASDHLPFQEAGFAVTFVQEGYFSAQYHQFNDSTTYLDFDYQTRMIKASLATVRVIDLSPPEVTITSVRDAGTGQAVQVRWAPADLALIDHYRLLYNTVPAAQEQSFDVPKDSARWLVSGLTPGQEYSFKVAAVDERGHMSVCFTEVTGTPYIRPVLPQNLRALPLDHAIRLDWIGGNNELDFDCYRVVRDGALLPARIDDTGYVDDDFLLGSELHAYLVVAIDRDGNISDTTGATPQYMRAATLDPGHILAINRSSKTATCIVDQVATGQFLRDALAGYDFDYYSDTAWGSPHRADTLHLIDMLNYELVVVGGESARTDDLASEVAFGGILDTLSYYLSLGGKAIIFSRWGELRSDSLHLYDTIMYELGTPYQGYRQYFDADRRVQYLSPFTTIFSDLIGAQSLDPTYPDLVWDSLATVAHSSPWTDVSGIPCPAYDRLINAPDILYSYVSREGNPYTQGKPVAWRRITSGYGYIFFTVPLSFMERSSAIAALQAAVSELASTGSAGATTIEPDTVDMPGGAPETIAIYLGDFMPEKTAADVDVGSLLVNSRVTPVETAILPSQPPFTGEVLQISISTDAFMASYTGVIDTITEAYVVSWKFNGESRRNYAEDSVVLIGQEYVAGDANGDGAVNIGDAVYVINYVFRGGPAPDPPVAGDANCDDKINVGDAVYIVNYIFRSGPAPCYQ
jgi:aminopeptidase YwaD